MKKHKNVLVLNNDYTPHAVVTYKEALINLYKNQGNRKVGYEPVSYYHGMYIQDTKGHQHPLPSVVKTPYFIKRGKGEIPYNKSYVFVRDMFTCQYCGVAGTPKDLTIDHVTPKCKWTGPGHVTNYENVVTACFSCNNQKGDKTLEQAGLKLKKKPVKPNVALNVQGLSPYMKVPRDWIHYVKPIFKSIQEEGV